MEELNAKTQSKQENSSGFKRLGENLEQLVPTWYRRTLWPITQKATVLTSHLLAAMAALLFGFFGVLFSGLALGWWLGDLLSNRALGFLLVAAFFLLIMIIIVLMRKKIVFPFFRDLILRKIYDTKD